MFVLFGLYEMDTSLYDWAPRNVNCGMPVSLTNANLV